jgi:hypothetical protein
MSTSTFVVSYVYTVTYLTGKMLFLLKEIIRDIGLDPSKFTSDWASYENAVRTWLASRHLERIRLEIYDSANNALVTFWDVDVVYTTVGDGSLWIDAAAVRYAIIKQGHAPSSCLYDIKVINKPGWETVPGWRSCELRSTEGFKRYAVGSAVGGNGISAEVAYWSK